MGQSLKGNVKTFSTKFSKVCMAMVVHIFNPNIQRQREVDLCTFEASLVYSSYQDRL